MGDHGHNRHGPERGGLLCPSGGAGSPSNTVWPGRGLLPCQVTTSSIQPFGHNYRHGPKIGWREAGSPSKTKSPGPRPTSVPSGILVHPAVWPQQTWAENWGCTPLGEVGAGFPSNTILSGPRSTSMPFGILMHPPFGHNRHGLKIGGCARLGEVGAGFPSNTVLPGPRSTSMPCGILMHPAVWAQ